MPIGSLAVAVYIANNKTLGQPALAAADGVVITPLISNESRGTHSGLGNQVNVAHAANDEERAAAFTAFIISLLTGKLPQVQVKYSALYLHLDGPGMIPVSLGMFVLQGTRLGPMDDTGRSLANHLHFELTDNSTGLSVRPTPMDGQTLNDSDDGRCMHSTNIPIP